jgi:hypothetical protein
MYQGTALSAIDHACCYAKSFGAGIFSGQSFGGKSIVLVGDLFQLKSVQGKRVADDIWLSPQWTQFRLVELTHMCHPCSA